MSDEECKAAICRAAAEFSTLAELVASMNAAQASRALALAKKSRARAATIVDEIGKTS